MIRSPSLTTAPSVQPAYAKAVPTTFRPRLRLHRSKVACIRNLQVLTPCLGLDAPQIDTSTKQDCTERQHSQEYSGSNSSSNVNGSGNSSVSLPAKGKQSALHVFGLTHLSPDSEPAEWIWQHKPSAVVFETAVNPSHGAETGSVVTSASNDEAAIDFRLRMFLQIANQLSDDTTNSPSESKIWQMVKEQFPGEQLAYIAALAVGAQLVFGDRCKSVTYQRLQNVPSLADLDAAYERLSAENYQDCLEKHSPPTSDHESERSLSASDISSEQHVRADCIRRILTEERDLVLANSIIEAARQAGSEGKVAGVIGAAHIAGTMRHLQSSTMDNIAALEVLQSGVAPMESPKQQGVRRALLTSCLALCCPSEVVADCTTQLGQLSPTALEAEQQATEIYGSTRMLLAVLSKEELQKICSGWNCDMYAILQPLRAVRPSNGGTGIDEDVVWDHVRDLSLIIG